MNQFGLNYYLTNYRRALVFIPMLALILSACFGQGGQLKPLEPSPTPGEVGNGKPVLVTFSELQADPHKYRGRAVRVSGIYYRLPPPDCAPFSGPLAEWALVAENLRLDVLGFESLLQLVPQEMELTVDGIFDLYEGPAGCGKGPPHQTLWLLEALQIVQPNPLVQAGPIFGPGQPGNIPLSTVIPPGSTPGGPTAEATDAGGTPLPGTTPTSTPITGGTVSPGGTATVTPTGIPTASSTAPGVLTASPTPTIISGGTTIPTSTPQPTSTTEPGQPTSTPFPTTEPPPTNPPPMPTATSEDGYPGPNTPTPTSTPGSYPG